MAARIRTLVIRFVLIVFGMALPPLSPSASAQNPLAPLSLEGLWELTEHGSLRDPDPAIVHIAHHSDDTVTAEFLSGAHCFDGKERIYAFFGKLVRQPTNPPLILLSSDDMWVCSGSPDKVKECGGAGAIKSHYQTSFKNATVTQALIKGTRVAQGVRGCALDPSSNGTAGFELRRLAPCELEAMKLDKAQHDLRDLLGSALGARVTFQRTIEAAEQRYGTQFNGRPTDPIYYPQSAVAGDWDSDAFTQEEFFRLLPVTVRISDWVSARAMLREMGSGPNPLPSAAAMLTEMDRLEAMVPDGRRALQSVENARALLEACQARQP